MAASDRAQDTEAIRAALDAIELYVTDSPAKWSANYGLAAASGRQIDAARAALGRLVARLEAAERVVRAAQEFLNCDEGTDIQFLSEDGIDFYNALEAALAAAAPGETEQTP